MYELDCHVRTATGVKVPLRPESHVSHTGVKVPGWSLVWSRNPLFEKLKEESYNSGYVRENLKKGASFHHITHLRKKEG